MLSETAEAFVADQPSQRHELVLYGCWKERRQCGAEPYSCDGNSPIQLRSSSVRGDEGDGGENEEEE